MKNLCVVLTLVATPAFAGGWGSIGNSLGAAGEAKKGAQEAQQREQNLRSGQQQYVGSSSIQCTPPRVLGGGGWRIQDCVETLPNGTQRPFSCTRDPDGRLSCK